MKTEESSEGVVQIKGDGSKRGGVQMKGGEYEKCYRLKVATRPVITN